MAGDRTARIAVFDARGRYQHVSGAILIENDAPPHTAAAPDLPRVDEQGIGARSRGADIVDRALPRIIFGPGALPLAAPFEDLRDARDRDRKSTRLNSSH